MDGRYFGTLSLIFGYIRYMLLKGVLILSIVTMRNLKFESFRSTPVLKLKWDLAVSM